MNFKEFKQSLAFRPITIRVGKLNNFKKNSLDNEALFQLPFIAMVVLVMAKGSVKPCVSQIGSLVGECVERSMPAFKRSNQHVGWSANLRVRTVKALSFLEMSGLINVDNSRNRISVTDLGRKVVSTALNDDTDLSHNLNMIFRQYRNVCKENKLEFRLN